MGDNAKSLLILGAGFLGISAARAALSLGYRVRGTTRSSSRAEVLQQMGVEAIVAPELSASLLDSLFSDRPLVLVTFPPDEASDAAVLQKLPLARASVYISSTGVYGETSGRIDEDTPVDIREPRAALRFATETLYRAQGAVVLRAAAIYGPGRGLHVRLKRGEHKVSEGGKRVVSRIHVDDLSRLSLLSLEAGLRDEVFVVADEAPVPQAEVIDWLCDRLKVPRPLEVSVESLPETLRHDRSIDGRRILRRLNVSLLYPSYREGFAACLDASP